MLIFLFVKNRVKRLDIFNVTDRRFFSLVSTKIKNWKIKVCLEKQL